MKSVALTLTGPEPRIDLEFYNREPGAAAIKVSGPIGLDGLYRRGDKAPLGVTAMKGNWLNDRIFVIQRMTLGGGFAAQKYSLLFHDEVLNIRGLDRNDREVSVEGGAWKP